MALLHPSCCSPLIVLHLTEGPWFFYLELDYIWTTKHAREDVPLWRTERCSQVKWNIFLVFAALFPDKALQWAASIAVVSCVSTGDKHLKPPNKNTILRRPVSPAFWSNHPHSHGHPTHLFPTQVAPVLHPVLVGAAPGGDSSALPFFLRLIGPSGLPSWKSYMYVQCAFYLVN